MALRLNTLFRIRTLPVLASHINTPYQEYSVEMIRKCYHIRGFPNIDSKDIYDMLFTVTKPNIEYMYPNYDWKTIWKNLNFKYLNIFDRNIIYRYIHEILPNDKRLYTIGNRITPLCDFCNVEQSNIHLFLYCHNIFTATVIKMFLMSDEKDII